MTLDIDLDRLKRCGFPEVVYAAGKTVDECREAALRIHAGNGLVLVTRADEAQAAALRAAIPAGVWHARSRCFLAGEPQPAHGPVAVLSAGTSDEPVAEEAALTLRARGVRVVKFADCGVAGLHRLLGHLDAIRSCVCVVAVAGFEGALPSVVGGLVDVPVIAVPTSVGYGVAHGGHAALHAMLSACAAGITVVNIDNGFGAGYAAATIARQSRR